MTDFEKELKLLKVAAIQSGKRNTKILSGIASQYNPTQPAAVDGNIHNIGPAAQTVNEPVVQNLVGLAAGCIYEPAVQASFIRPAAKAISEPAALSSFIRPAAKVISEPAAQSSFIRPAAKAISEPAAQPSFIRPAASSPHVQCTATTKTREIHIPPEKPNTKPLFQLLANGKECLNSSCTLRIASFTKLLRDYPSPEFPKLLSEILRYRAKLGYVGPDRAKIRRPNHPSAWLYPETYRKKLQRKSRLVVYGNSINYLRTIIAHHLVLSQRQ